MYSRFHHTRNFNKDYKNYWAYCREECISDFVHLWKLLNILTGKNINSLYHVVNKYLLDLRCFNAKLGCRKWSSVVLEKGSSRSVDDSVISNSQHILYTDINVYRYKYTKVCLLSTKSLPGQYVFLILFHPDHNCILNILYFYPIMPFMKRERWMLLWKQLKCQTTITSKNKSN